MGSHILHTLEQNKDYKKTLWHYFKQYNLVNKQDAEFILVFDQFEELFSYPDEQVKEFKEQLQQLINDDLPKTVKQFIAENPDIEEQTDILLDDLNIKTVFAIRSDKLSLINKLTDKLPDIQKTFYELAPLNMEQAKQAMVQPAKDKGKFKTLPFDFSQEALDTTINTLSNNSEQDIETTQLQIICQSIEDIAQEKAKNTLKEEPIVISKNDLPEFKNIFLNFYDSAVKQTKQKTDTQKFVEDQLIRNNQRISLDEIICKDYVTNETLKTLTDTHLLRAERNSTGGFSYELSHDTLIEPILISRTKRKQEEEEERVEKERKEELRIAKEKAEKERIENEKKRKRQRTIIFIVLVAAVISILLSVWAIVSMNKAKKQEKIAKQQTEIAKEQTERADEKTKEAENKTNELAEQKIELEKALQKANEAEDLAEQKRLEAEIQKNKAEQLANGAMDLLKRSLPAGETDVYAFYIKQADTAFAKGNYDEAIGFYKSAKILPKGIAKAKSIHEKISEAEKCLEWHKQAGNYVFELKLDKAISIYKKIIKKNPEDPRALWRIESLSRPTTLPMLESLKLITVKGGSFKMESNDSSDEKPIHKVILSDYQISTYEITNQQYATFLNQYGSDKIKEGIYAGEEMIYEHDWSMQKNGDKWQPQEGYENHPVVYVTWYGAYEFCRFYSLNLPTEAQWEYAAKAPFQGVGGQYAGTNNENELKDYAWYDDNSYDLGSEHVDYGTHQVGTKKPNELGLYDMSGNVWEWCNDWYLNGYYNESPENNPKGHLSGSYRVTRGGSWYDFAYYCRVARRAGNSPNDENYFLGFRAGFF